MKPEILPTELRRLEALALRHREVFRTNEAKIRAKANSHPFASEHDDRTGGWRDPFVQTLMTLPLVTVHASIGYDEGELRVQRFRVARDIAVDLSAEPVLYRLSEERFEIGEDERLSSAGGPQVILTSENLRDVLEAGYEDIAEDEMMEKLLPIIQVVEDRAEGEPTSEEISAVEDILGLPSLTASERLRVRDEIAGFLEGRVDAGDFISRAVQRDAGEPALYEGAREGLRFTQSIEEP